MTALLDEPIAVQTAAGQPFAITWRGMEYQISVLMSWDDRLFRVATTVNGAPATADISCDSDRWRVRHWWTS